MICFFMFSMYVSFSNKDLLRFHNPIPFIPCDLPKSEKVVGERSVEKATRTSVFFTNFCKLLNMEKGKSTLLLMYPEECCWRNVYRLVLVFLILHVSHKSYYPLICIIFAKDFFFKPGLPLCASNLALVSNLKSPPSTTFLLESWLISRSTLLRSDNVVSCSDSVFAL